MTCRDLRMIAPLVFAWAGALFCCVPATAAEPGFADLVTDSSLVFTIPVTARPQYLVPAVDPTFGLPVVRITGNTGTNFPLLDGTTGTWGGEVRHHYSKTQPWSADGALLMIENAASSGGIPTRVILDGETYQPLWGRCSYLLDDARWHPTLEHARELIGVRESVDSLVWFDPVTCSLTRGWKLPLKPTRIGMSEGNASHDGRFIAMANKSAVVIVDMDPQPPHASYAEGNRRIGPVYTFPACSLDVRSPNSGTVANVSISPSGRYLDVKYSGSSSDTTADAHRIFAIDPVTLAIRPQNMADASARCGSFQARPNGWIMPLKHADMALDPFDGNEDVIVGGRACTGSTMGRVVKVRMRDGAVTPLTSPDNEASVRHVSARNLDRPGWVYASYYKVAGKRFSDEIVAVKLDGSLSAQRFTHTHSAASSCYRCEPQAVPARDGRRVLWASNWAQDCVDCGSMNEVKAFVVDGRSTEPPAVDRPPVLATVADTTVAETETLQLTVTATDPDGAAIAELTARLDGLPPGHDATFEVAPDGASGTLTWTPSYAAARDSPYVVTFTAHNTLTGTASTLVRVTNVDRAPTLLAPDSATVRARGTLVVAVGASDPDGDPIDALVVDLADLPGAEFTPDSTGAAGTLAWTPGPELAAETPYVVRLAAHNTQVVTDSIAVVVTPDALPVLAAPDTVHALEGQTVSFHVAAWDPDGDPLVALTVDRSALPNRDDTAFLVSAAADTGTFAWTPGPTHAGAWPVTFTTRSTAAVTRTTWIVVADVDRAPVVEAPAELAKRYGEAFVVEVYASDPDGDPLDSLRADLSELPPGADAVFVPNPDGASGTLTWTPALEDVREAPWIVRFVATNTLENTTTTLLHVLPDRAPVLSATSGLDGAESAPLIVTFAVADPDGDAVDSLVADLSGLPAEHDATFEVDGLAGTLRWTPGFADAGTWPVRLRAANALVADTTFTITVANTDRAPVVSAPAEVAGRENEPLAFAVSASDPDGDAVLLDADLSAFPGASFVVDSTGAAATFAWTPDFDRGGSAWPVVVRATNALAGEATTLLVIESVDRPPALDAPAMVTAYEGAAMIVEVGAADPDGDAVDLTADLSALPPDHDAAFTPLGPGVGRLTWTPTSADGGGSFAIVFVAANALADTATTLVEVAEVDRPPALTVPPTFAAAENVPVSITVAAVDPDGTPLDSLTADLGALPAGHDAVFVPDAGLTSGTLTWTPTYRDARATPYVVTFRAANALVATASTAITVANADAPPAVTAPAAVNGGETTKLTFTVTASDLDGQAITSLVADFSGLPSGHNAAFSVNGSKTSGTFSWTPTYAHGRTEPYVVRFTAANTLSGSALTAVTIANLDRAPKVAAPSSKTIKTGQTLTFQVTASDPDGEAITAFVADVSALPAGHGATFTPDSTLRAGTFTWVPRTTGTFKVTFTASNALSGSGTTSIKVNTGTEAERVALEGPTADAPLELALAAPAPNPARDVVRFTLALPRPALVRWSVHDLLGRRVAGADREERAGWASWSWGAGRDAAPPGVYVLRVAVEGRVFTRRFVRAP